MLNPVAVAANIRVGFDALRIHPLRTLLSVLGITIGCASLIATMAVSDGLLGFARDTIRKQTSVQVIEISPRKAVFRDGQWVAVHDYPVFTAADAQALHAYVGPGSATTMTLSGQTTARHRGKRHYVHLSLGTAALPDFGGVDIAAGRFFSDVESEHNAPVVVVNHALAREFLPGRDPHHLVGKEIHVHDRRRRVIGILAATPFEDRENPSFLVIAPIGAARVLLDPPASGRFAPVIQMLAPTLESVDHVQGSIVDWVARRYPRWQERVNVTVRLEQLAEVEKAINLTKLFVAALVGISLVVGGVGIMNVLLASVAERTREIGIRKSVGARAADIRQQFLTEAVAIALVGAAAGLVIGFVVAAGVTAGFRQLAGVAIYPVLSVESVLIATLASSLVGLLFGTYPARRAASLPPVVAIAQE
jgi:putative ABC transport system permease protein